MFDPDHHGVIYFPVFIIVMSKLRRGNLEDRARLAFTGYDVDEDDAISRGDFRKIFESFARAAFTCILFIAYWMCDIA